MSDDRLESILSKQRAAAARRAAAEEEKRQREAEAERRKQALLVAWDGVRNDLKKIVFELNRRLAPNEISLKFEEKASNHEMPYGARVTYENPYEYRIKGSSLDVSVSRSGLLGVSLVENRRHHRSEQMNIADFDEPTQRTWVFDFLEITAEPDAAE